MPTKFDTLAEYVTAKNITVTIVHDHGWQWEGRPGDKNGWEYHGYDLILTNPGTHGLLATPWKQGTGIEASPTDDVASVVANLVNGVQVFQDYDLTFEEWARDLGYDTDSRKAEAMYNAAKAQEPKVRAFIGAEDFDMVIELANDF